MLASLIAGFASGETVLALRRAKRAALVYLLAALSALCGAGFLIAAFYIWAAERYGPIEAALGISALFILIAVLILVLHSVAARARARRSARERGSDLKAIGLAAAVAALPSLMRAKPGFKALVVPAAVLAAYAFYRRARPQAPDLPPE